MLKKILFIIVCNVTFINFAQQPYKRHWGTLYPAKAGAYFNILAPLNSPPDTARIRNFSMMPVLNKKTQRLFLAEDPDVLLHTTRRTTKIFEFNENSNHIIQHPINLAFIENMLFDNANNILIQGIQFVPNSSTAFRALFKYSLNGTLTLFKRLSGEMAKNSIAIDHLNNIYVLTKQDKNTVLFPSNFQNTGDQNTIINNQDVISKYDANGNHIWSTFYFNNQSHIWGIAAGTNGLYVYGHEFFTTANSSYFGTPNSYQSKASGIYNGGNPSNAKNAFLSKFDFDGKRVWSTYYGTQQSMVPMQNTVQINKNMEVVGDDVYIITDHIITQHVNSKLSSPNAAIQTSYDITNTKTLTKFSGDGTKLWTSYLYDTETLYATPDKKIMLSGTNNLLTNLPNGTADAYQDKVKGQSANLTYVITSDGNKIEYLSYFGDLNRENGIAIPSKNGYYVIGGTTDNRSRSSNINTVNAPYTKLEIIDTYYNRNLYVGNFVAFFTNKKLSVEDHSLKNNNDINCKVYPNPTSDILYIENEEALSTNSYFVLFDINGKRLLEYKAIDSYKNNISLEHLPTGVYILELQTGNQKYQTKIIKK